MNKCSDPNSNNTKRDPVNGRRVCMCESCISERQTVAALRAMVSRRGATTRPILAWISSEEWFSYGITTKKRGMVETGLCVALCNKTSGEIPDAR